MAAENLFLVPTARAAELKLVTLLSLAMSLSALVMQL